MRHAGGPARAVTGILLLDKPAGLTSNAALQRAKRLYAAEKAGHTGTLDPLATGLLPLCFGDATKFAQSLLDAPKEYVATVHFGVATTTGDAEGEVLADIGAAQPELVGVGEHGLVAVGRGIYQRDRLARADAPPVYLHFSPRGAREAAIRCVEAQEFLHRIAQQRRIGAQLLLERDVTREVHRDAAQQDGRRHQSHDQHLPHATCEQHFGKRLSRIVARREQRAGGIDLGITRFAPPLCYHLGGHFGELRGGHGHAAPVEGFPGLHIGARGSPQDLRLRIGQAEPLAEHT